MASTPPKKGKPANGVRGPGGPQASGGVPAKRPAPNPSASAFRRKFEEISFPILRRLARVPRWLIVILPAILLLLGLIQTGSLAWLGGVLLLLVFLMLAWLTALSWPALSVGSRAMRAIVLAALLGITILKFAGRF